MVWFSFELNDKKIFSFLCSGNFLDHGFEFFRLAVLEIKELQDVDDVEEDEDEGDEVESNEFVSIRLALSANTELDLFELFKKSLGVFDEFVEKSYLRDLKRLARLS